jgi:hypothetical protein
MTNKSVYFWQELPDLLQEKLMSNNFVKMDCLADGNCQFRSIETALKHAGYKITHKKLRAAISKYIYRLSNQDFALIINNYRQEKENGIFIGNWNPFEINNKKDFINEIKKDGFHFQGDDVTLSLLTKILKTDFLIISDDQYIIDTSNRDQLNDRIIILHYKPFDNNGHYQTIGLKKQETPRKTKIETIFFRNNLPIDVKRLFDKHEMMTYHIQNVCNKETCQKENMHQIISKIENNLGKSITKNDRCDLIKILYTWIHNNNYLQQQ